ncbi:DegV family protein [Pseudarthrobacter sp. J64]|uniref:DegV family protein n=1 Tax=Pseudarthrobacter sp. J64 TaxID=3116485 RepID=UPI002E81C00D|nr:DegV family protein [Pseudarthrobacter sp. J64]MEE2569194.1 DegV family protein [Pseudarthrobacter sp. J64]
MPDRDTAAWLWLRERFAAVRGGRQPVPVAPVPESVTTAVVTDSAAALPLPWVQGCSPEGLLTVVPMPVMVGEEIYGEGEDDISETIAVALASGSAVKTSRPSPGQFEQAYLAAARRGFSSVVSIHISGGLSGTADAARLAASRVQIPVQVIDTRTVAMAQGMAVQNAVVAAGSGAEADDVARAAAGGVAGSSIYFYVPSLEQLRRGGRIGAAASLLGTVLAIKPILSVQDGRIVPLEKVRSAAKAIARLEELAIADAAARPAGSARLAVHHFGNAEQAAGLVRRLGEALPQCPPAQASALPAVLAAHAGLGVLAVIVGERTPALPGLAELST